MHGLKYIIYISIVWSQYKLEFRGAGGGVGRGGACGEGSASGSGGGSDNKGTGATSTDPSL